MENTPNMSNQDKTSQGTQKDPLLDNEELNNEQLNSDGIDVKIDDLKDVFNKVSNIAQEAGQWSESTIKLFFVEILRNVAAAQRFVVCQLLFIPLLILFIFSLCVSIGIVAYSLTYNLLIAVGFFLLAMSLVLLGLIYWQKYLTRFFGFKETIAQLKEGADVISKAAKSFD